MLRSTIPMDTVGSALGPTSVSSGGGRSRPTVGSTGVRTGTKVMMLCVPFELLFGLHARVAARMSFCADELALLALERLAAPKALTNIACRFAGSFSRLAAVNVLAA